MEVYIEYAILDNLIINSILILSARKILKLDVSKIRIIISAFVGTTVSIFLPLLKINQGWLLIIKFALGIMLTCLGGKFSRLKDFVLCFYTFLFLTFLFGGCAYAILTSLNADFNVWSNTTNYNLPLFLIIAFSVILYFLINKIVKTVYSKRELNGFIYNCAISFSGQTFKCVGLMDSGNRLYHKKTGRPVVICSKDMKDKIISSGAINDKGCDLIYLTTASGRKLISIYKSDNFLIYNGNETNTINNVMVGFTDYNFCDDEKYDMLLSPSLIKGEVC